MADRPAVDIRKVVIEQDLDDLETWWLMDEQGIVSCGTRSEIEARVRRQDKRRSRRNPEAIVATVISLRTAP